MRNYFFIISSKFEYFKFEKLIQELSHLENTKIFVISFEKWNNGNVSECPFPDFVEFLIIPKIHETELKQEHFRNDKSALKTLILSLQKIVSSISDLNTNKHDVNLIVYHTLHVPKSFGLQSLFETSIKGKIIFIRVQKTLLSDLDFYANKVKHGMQSFLAEWNLLRFVINLIKSKISINDFIILIKYLIRWRLILVRTYLTSSTNFIAYNTHDFDLLKKKYRRNIFLANNPELHMLKERPSYEIGLKNIIFFTSGVFKYSNLFEMEKQILIIRKLSQFASRSGYEFKVKPKIGEIAQLQKLLQNESIEIIDDNIDFSELKFDFISICSLTSSVFSKSIIQGRMTFFYLVNDKAVQSGINSEILENFSTLNVDCFIGNNFSSKFQSDSQSRQHELRNEFFKTEKSELLDVFKVIIDN